LYLINGQTVKIEEGGWCGGAQAIKEQGQTQHCHVFKTEMEEN
jgi:hypothetical protein